MGSRGRPKPCGSQWWGAATLQRWSRRHTSAQSLALRCRIVLACANGGHGGEVRTSDRQCRPLSRTTPLTSSLLANASSVSGGGTTQLRRCVCASPLRGEFG